MRSRPDAFQCSIAAAVSSSSAWPTASASVRNPSLARYSRTSWRQELEEVDHELRLPGETLPQLGVLGGDTDRAGVQVADAHHHAASDHERRGGEAELLSAEQRRDDHVAAGLQLPVDLHHDPVPQPVAEQRLLGLGEPELPRRPGMLDAGQRGRAGTAVMAGDQHDVGVRLGHAGGHGADPDLGDQLDVIRAAGLAFFRSWISWARSSIE